MTTLISLAARDFMVVGCDSLATASERVIGALDFTTAYFDPNGNLKKGLDGSPLLKSATQIFEMMRSLPVDQLPSVEKLFDLEPYRACLMFAGTSRIGEMTIRNLVQTFKDLPLIRARRPGSTHKGKRTAYTMQWLAAQLRDYILKIYAKEVPNEWQREAMDVIVSGYSQSHREPEIWMLQFRYDWRAAKFEPLIDHSVPRGEYNVIFGGQYDVVQRIVRGIDESSTWALRTRIATILEEFHDGLLTQVQAVHPAFSSAKPDFLNDQKYNIFRDGGGVSRISTDIGSLSEQAGIDLVSFLVSVMIKAQEFSSSIATVGGNVHVALLTKDTPFRWISPEVYRFENQQIPRTPHA